MFRLLVSRRWRVGTLLALVAVAVTIRLGFWQLDRLEQRRALNARIQAQMEQPSLALSADTLGADLVGMEYRSATVSGQYDHSQQVALRNQRWEGQLGLHLLTPLVISGTRQAIMVDRGWIPMEALAPERWREFAEPGAVEVRGMLRGSRHWPYFGGLIDPEPAAGETRRTWGLVDLERIDQQVSYELLPVYIQQAPEPGRTALPQRSVPEFEFGEGSHLGYAIQWFAFAVVIAVGYPAFVRHTELGGTGGAKGTGGTQGTEGSVVRSA